MSYYRFIDEENNEYGSFEVFHEANGVWTDEEGEQHDTGAGWYWWPCFPGCVSDSDPIGPFDTEQEAIKDARS